MGAVKLKTQKLTVLAVSSALQTALLLMSAILPSVKVSVLFAASIFNGLLCSAGYNKRHVFMSFISVGILSLIFIPNYIIPVSYILFFGAYGIVHFATKAKGLFVKQTIRFAYLAAGSAALFFIFKAFFSAMPLFNKPYIYFLPIALAVGYLAFQLVYDMVIKEYFKNQVLSSLIADNDIKNM